MDFEIPQDLKMIQSLVRDFVTSELKPLERDLLGRTADLSDARVYLPEETEARLVKMANDIGLWGINVPEEVGGVGMGTLCSVLVEEELAQTVVPFNFGDTSPILFECNPEQKEKYFLPVLKREKRAYFALAEPGQVDGPASISLAAEKDNGGYRLSGRKLSLSRPGKDYFAAVFAATDSGEKEGVTCFLVDRDTPGFSVSGGVGETGWQAGCREPLLLAFDRCLVPAENILGEVGRAFHLGERWLPGRRIVRSARAVGVGQRLLEEAATQAQSFSSFGALVSRRAGIEAALASMAVQVHAGRLVVYEAAAKADKGEPIRMEAALAKLFASEMLASVADRASHIFGGPPYIAGMPMERLCRSALAESASELSLAIQRNLISREIEKGLKV